MEEKFRDVEDVTKHFQQRLAGLQPLFPSRSSLRKTFCQAMSRYVSGDLLVEDFHSVQAGALTAVHYADILTELATQLNRELDNFMETMDAITALFFPGPSVHIQDAMLHRDKTEDEEITIQSLHDKLGQCSCNLIPMMDKVVMKLRDISVIKEEDVAIFEPTTEHKRPRRDVHTQITTKRKRREKTMPTDVDESNATVGIDLGAVKDEMPEQHDVTAAGEVTAEVISQLLSAETHTHHNADGGRYQPFSKTVSMETRDDHAHVDDVDWPLDVKCEDDDVESHYSTPAEWAEIKVKRTKKRKKKTMKPPIATENEKIKEKSSAGGVFMCDVCSKVFVTHCRMTFHRKTVHSEERPYTCETCGKGFKTKSSVNKHVDTVHAQHGAERKFMCSHCGKTYADSAALERHELSQHTAPEDRPHRCSECGFGFSTATRLKYHRYTHTGERPFLCDVCGKGFSDPTTKRKHRMTHFPPSGEAGDGDAVTSDNGS